MNSFLFKNIDIPIDDSWSTFFTENANVLKKIEEQIRSNYTPSDPLNIFKIFKLRKDKIKYVIIGQDPYPAEGMATGRCFEVNTNSWSNAQQSLRPILCAVYYHENNKTFLPYEKVIEQINNKTWNVDAPNILFESLETDKGVFLLNKSLTCEVKSPGTHMVFWESFINLLVKEITKNEDIIWFLLGNKAKSLQTSITTKHQIIKAFHPSFCYESDFTIVNANRLKGFAEEFRYDLIV